MKKLYENIEDINIKGGVGQLTEMVTTMDRALQQIADNTDQLNSILIKYSASNKGNQYEKVVMTLSELRDRLFESSQALNDMQKQIVEYQNKIYRYEDMLEAATKPNEFLVTKRNISVDTTVVQFNRADMLSLAATLKIYSEKVFSHTKTINEKKNSIGAIWKDSQYTIFSDFIDSVTREIIEALKVFEEYVQYLYEKIKELN